MLQNNDQSWRWALVAIIFVLGGVIFYEALPFLSGVLGACTVYIMIRKQMGYLTENRGFKKAWAAILLLVEVILLFLIPISLAVWLLSNRISKIDLEPTALVNSIEQLVDTIHSKTGYDLLSSENIAALTGRLTFFAQIVVNQVSSFAVNSVVLLFVLYFMLLGGRKMEHYIFDILPFSPQNKAEVVNSIRVMIRSNTIGIPLLAAIQGCVAMVGYIIFGTPDPVLFGFLTCFATIIPLVGTSLVWFPLAAYLALTGHVPQAIGLAVYALAVISNVDNVIRFMLQKKLADTHPLITIFGVIMGLSLFGFWGVIFGPLMLSLFLLCFDIYKRDYIDGNKIGLS